jgi:hypothetical protein
MERYDPATKRMTMIQGRAVRACELRLEHQVSDERGQEQTEYVCGASGGLKHGYVLAREGEDLSSMFDTCNTCPIPDVVEHRRACLNLAPVRVFPGGRHALPVVQPHAASQNEPSGAYYTCRWFYSLYGQQQPRDISMCLSCPYWFPRPPRELIPDYWPFTHKMLRLVTGEDMAERPPTGFTPASHEVTGGWWRRLLHKFHL